MKVPKSVNANFTLKFPITGRVAEYWKRAADFAERLKLQLTTEDPLESAIMRKRVKRGDQKQ